MAVIRHGTVKACIAGAALWLAVSSLAMATTVYRCPDPRTKTTIFQDRPCEAESAVTPSPKPAEMVITATPVTAEQAPIASAAQAASAPEPAKSPVADAELLIRSAWVLPGVLAGLLVLSGAVLWLWWHGRRRPQAQSWETHSLLILPEPPPKPDSWTLPLLQSLEWKRFEELCVAYYRSTGLRAEATPIGHAGGVDIHLYDGDVSEPRAIVLCKAWKQDVELGELQEFQAVRVAEKISQAIFITSSIFSKEAIIFARENGISLLDGRAFLALLRGLPPAQSRQFLTWVTEGDYTTPSCPVCGLKMSEREGSRGLFWGCRGYPHCKGKLSIHGVSI